MSPPPLKNRNRYIVWDGKREVAHNENDPVQDYICLYDGPVSLAGMRSEFCRRGCIFTVLFACRRGGTTTGTHKGGTFTTQLLKLMHHDPNVSFRDAVSLVNRTKAFREAKQESEVVCRQDVLDLAVMNASVPDAINVVQIIDACRTPLPDWVPIHPQQQNIRPAARRRTTDDHKNLCRADISRATQMGPGSVFVFYFAGHAGTR